MRSTFTNEQLCSVWGRTANSQPKGTRMDVVVELMGEAGIEDNDENRRKTYNNVTQRVRQLAKGGVQFPELAPGKRGGNRSTTKPDELQSILDAAAEVEAEIEENED